MKRIICIFLLFAMLFAVSGCSQRELAQQQLAQAKEENRHEATTFAMDTIMTLTVYDETANKF